MARLPYSVRRHGRFFVRVKVPLDLQKSFGRKEIRRSLRTSDYGVAAHRLPSALGEIRAEFERIRRSQVYQSGGPDGVTLLSEVVGAFKADRRSRWSQKMIIETDFVLSILLDVLGDRPIVEIQRADLRSYRDLVRRLPPNFRKRKLTRGKTILETVRIAEANGWPTISRGTLNRYVGHAHALFEWAENEQIITKNLAKGLTVAKTEGHAESEDRDRFPRIRKRRPYERDELQRLFSLSPWSDGDWDDPLYWSVLLSLFNGLRQAETLQLIGRNVVTVEEITCLDVTDAGPGQRLKNRSSIRMVPVHGVLIELGFRDHVARMGNNQPIVPNVSQDPRGRFDRFAKAYGKFLRKHNFDGLCFHGLRHTWRDALRDAEVPLDLSNRMGGWSTAGVSESYGSNNPIRVMDSHLRRVTFGCEYQISRKWRRATLISKAVAA